MAFNPLIIQEGRLRQYGNVGIGDLSDVNLETVDTNYVIKYSGLEWEASKMLFTHLSDVPTEYTGNRGKYLRVKDTEDALEFADGSGGITDHSELTSLAWADSGHNINTELDVNSNSVLFAEISTPANPAGNNIKLYAKDSAGVTKLCALDSDGTETVLGAGGAGGAVDSVFGRTGVVVAETDDYTWAQIDKTTSDIADIATKSHTSLTDIGTTTHEDIDIHIADEDNPHATTAAQVGAVDLISNEDVSGVKNFLDIPTCNSLATEGSQLVNKDYADGIATGLNWTYSPVISKALSTPPLSPSVADKYIVKPTGDGAWAGHDNDIAIWVGSWTFITKTDGLAVLNLEDNTQWRYVSSIDDWVKIGVSKEYVAGNGLALDAITFKLGGSLSEHTTLQSGAYNMVWNLNGSGGFYFQDSGSTRLHISNAGEVGIGETAVGGIQNIIRPSSNTKKGLAIRAYSSSATANLFELQDSSGNDIGYINSGGFLSLIQTVNQSTYPSGYFKQTASTLQSQTTGGVDETIDNSYEALKFTATGNHQIRNIGVPLKATGTITNTTTQFRAYLYTDNAGVPGSQVSGSSYGYVLLGSISSSYTTKLFNIGSVTLVSGTSYWIVLRPLSSPVGGTIQVNRNATGTALYAYSSDGSSWTPEDSKQAVFYLYGKTGNALMGYVDNSEQTGVTGSSATGYGVHGISTSNRGVFGSSVNNVGVYGRSDNNYGGYFTSTVGTGCYASATAGYAFQGISTTGDAFRANTTSGRGLYTISTTGTALQAETISGTGIYVSVNPATTSVSHQMLRLRRSTSATATNGIGSYINFELEQDDGDVEETAHINVALSVATASSVRSYCGIELYHDTVLAEKFRFTSDGFLGIGMIPTCALDVTGAGKISGTFGVDGTFNVNKNKFTVASATGNTVVAGTLGVTSDLAVNKSKFTVAASNGNTVVAGTLGASGLSTFQLGAVFNETGNSAGDVRIESDLNANFFWTDASAEKLYLGTTGVGAGYYAGAFLETFDVPSGNDQISFAFNATLGTSLGDGHYHWVGGFRGIATGLSANRIAAGWYGEVVDDGTSTGGELIGMVSLAVAGTAQTADSLITYRGVVASKAASTATGLYIPMMPALLSGATLTNAYGIYIERDKEATNNYAIFANGTIHTEGFATEELNFTAVNGANNNIDIDDGGVTNMTFIRITGPTGAFSISGIARPRNGHRVTLFNDTTQAMTITNDATSTDANRIFTMTGGNIATTGTGVVELVYSPSADGGVGKWIVTSFQA